MGGKGRNVVGDKKAGQDRFNGFKRRNLRGWDKGRACALQEGARS